MKSTRIITSGVPIYDRFDLQWAPVQETLIGIPVINEGDRLISQLRAMQQNGLTADTDVVIADGGSTDGSTDTDRLTKMGVHALLVKRGAGALSAQLRMLFHYAVTEGYKYVLTVDGNGKDDTAGLRLVLHELKNGCSFVQGSRYVPGGIAENTPWDRHFAVKYVHAPLLSLGAQHHFTDTTNGLRGWRVAALADERVNVFRPVFDAYNLHYYLTVRLPRLGYSCCEVPVTRCYPTDGPTPSKISSPWKKIKLLGPLFKAAAGGYRPQQ